MTSSRLDHIGIFVSDLDAAVTVFTESFDLEVGSRIEDPAKGVRAAFLPWGGTSIELFQPTDPARQASLASLGGPLHHIGVLVDDLDAALTRLAGAGIEAAGTPQELGGRRAVFLDIAPLMNARVQLVESLS